MTSPESLAAPESAAPASTPLPFPVLLPYAIPTMGLVRSQVSEALLAHMTVYAQGAATLSHAQAVTSLNALRDLLPTCSTIVASKPASRIVPGPGRFLADDAAHDAYFRVCRVSDPEGVAFLRSILMATALFRAEMASTYASLHAQRFAAISSGFAALLGQIAGIRIALVEDTIAESAAAAAVHAAVNPTRRWVLGHQIFAALTQGIIFALKDFEAAVREAEHGRASQALTLAADLLMASAAAFRFTADFPPSAYSDLVRPSMMAQHVGEGFSGLLSLDHRQLVAVLTHIRPLMGETEIRHEADHRRLSRALNHVYDSHKFVCAQFGLAEKPSLRCPHSSSLPSVDELDRYQRARAHLLQPNSRPDALILE